MMTGVTTRSTAGAHPLVEGHRPTNYTPIKSFTKHPTFAIQVNCLLCERNGSPR